MNPQPNRRNARDVDSRDTHQLIDSLLDGDISTAEFLQLEAELSVDESVRREYFDRIVLDMLLEAEAGVGAQRTATNARAKTFSEKKQTVFNSSRSILIAMIVSVAAAVLFMFAWRGNLSDPNIAANAPQGRSENATHAELEASGYAVIIGQEAVVWRNSPPRANGSLLPTGEVQLSAGIIQIELFSGVSVVVEGPAEFSVTSPMEMVVAKGKVRAHVPEPAHGFRVATRAADIVDLGTDFAVDVRGDRAELHVLEGEVELQPRGGESPRRFETGQAVSLSNDGRPNDLHVDTTRFVGREQITKRLQNAQRSRREQWVRWSEQLRIDPRVVALYQVGLSDGADRRLVNRATGAASHASEGAVVAAARAADRWQHTGGALDFSPTGSRIRMSIPGEYQSLTLTCWVKINSLDRWYNSLFLTDGHDQNEPHWQIMDDGRLFFSVKKRDTWDASKGERDKHIFYSPPFWTTSLSGRWLMISTVYDFENRQVTHFLNGAVISTEAIPEEYLVERVRIGNASLCNWGLPERDEPRFAVRNLNGSLDEFVMYNAALSPVEIKELYHYGQP